MFRGVFVHVLDEKGRTSLPKDWRAHLAGPEPPWLTADQHCLAIYPAEKFESKQRRLAAVAETNESAERLLRLSSLYAIRCPFDRQGRILIPAPHREWAGLDREITLGGKEGHIEIWDRQRLAEELGSVRDDWSDLRNKSEPGLKEAKE
jgi:MraZ protein